MSRVARPIVMERRKNRPRSCNTQHGAAILNLDHRGNPSLTSVPNQDLQKPGLTRERSYPRLTLGRVIMLVDCGGWTALRKPYDFQGFGAMLG